MLTPSGRTPVGRAHIRGKDALAAFAHAYRKFALEHPGRYAANQMKLDPAVIAGSPGHLRNIETPGALLRGYGLTEPDVTDAVRLLRSAFHGYVSLEASGGFSAARDITTSWERAVDALHIALENWPSTATEGKQEGHA